MGIVGSLRTHVAAGSNRPINDRPIDLDRSFAL